MYPTNGDGIPYAVSQYEYLRIAYKDGTYSKARVPATFNGQFQYDNLCQDWATKDADQLVRISVGDYKRTVRASSITAIELCTGTEWTIAEAEAAAISSAVDLSTSVVALRAVGVVATFLALLAFVVYMKG